MKENLSNHDVLMNIADVARYLKMSPARIRYEVHLMRIPYLKIGVSIRFSKKSIDAWLEAKSREVKV